MPGFRFALAVPAVLLFGVILGCGARGELTVDPLAEGSSNPDGGAGDPSEYCAEMLLTALSRIRVTRTRGMETIGVLFVGGAGPGLFEDTIALPDDFVAGLPSLNGEPVSLTFVYGASGFAEFSDNGVQIDLRYNVDPVVGATFEFQSDFIPFTTCP